MKIKLLLFFICFSCGAIHGQTDSPKTKFDFLNYKNGNAVKLKSGRYIEIELKTSDTAHVYVGEFEKLEADSIFVTLSYEYHFYESNNFEDSYTLRIDKNIEGFTLHKSEVEKVKTYSALSEIGNTLSGAGLFGLIFSPVASLDKKSDDGFNTKRYKKLLKISAGALILGLPLNIGNKHVKIP